MNIQPPMHNDIDSFSLNIINPCTVNEHKIKNMHIHILPDKYTLKQIHKQRHFMSNIFILGLLIINVRWTGPSKLIRSFMSCSEFRWQKTALTFCQEINSRAKLELPACQFAAVEAAVRCRLSSGPFHCAAGLQTETAFYKVRLFYMFVELCSLNSIAFFPEPTI